VTEKVAEFRGTLCGSGPSGGRGGGRETVWITSTERAEDAEGTGALGRMKTVGGTRELCGTEDKTVFSGWMVWGGMADGHEFGLCEGLALDGDETGQWRERDGRTRAVLLAEIEIDAPAVHGEATVCSVGMEERGVAVVGVCAGLFPEDLFEDVDGGCAGGDVDGVGEAVVEEDKLDELAFDLVEGGVEGAAGGALFDGGQGGGVGVGVRGGSRAGGELVGGGGGGDEGG